MRTLAALVFLGLLHTSPSSDRFGEEQGKPGPLAPEPLLLLHLAQEELPGPPDVSEVVASVQAFYDSITSYHADFEQIYTNVALTEDQVSSGHMYFLKPGRMRWDYLSPQEKYLISDGETLWIYEPEFNQVARLDLDRTEFPSALRFLMGQGVLVDDFEITSCSSDTEGGYCLHLVSRIGEGDYQYLEFLVDGTDFSVRETLVVDPIGNRNRFVFANVVTTDPLPAEGFHFTPPPDARIVTPETH